MIDRQKKLRQHAAKTIETARKSEGLSQESLAKTIGVDQSVVSRIERAKDGVSFWVIVRAVLILGLPVSALDDELEDWAAAANWLRILPPERRRLIADMGLTWSDVPPPPNILTKPRTEAAPANGVSRIGKNGGIDRSELAPVAVASGGGDREK